jgi:hypothetical protein
MPPSADLSGPRPPPEARHRAGKRKIRYMQIPGRPPYQGHPIGTQVYAGLPRGQHQVRGVVKGT